MNEPKSSVNRPLFFSMKGLPEEPEEVWWKLRSDRKALEELDTLMGGKEVHYREEAGASGRDGRRGGSGLDEEGERERERERERREGGVVS